MASTDHLDNKIYKQQDTTMYGTNNTVDILPLNILMDLFSQNESMESQNVDNQLSSLVKEPGNIVILVVGFFSLCTNIGSVLAIWHAGSLHNKLAMSVHLKLIMSLTSSIMFIIICEVLKIFSKTFQVPFNVMTHRRSNDSQLLEACLRVVISGLNFTSYLVYLLNLLLISVDHYLAIIHPLHYTTLMTDKHVHLLMILVWILATLGGFINFVHINRNKTLSPFLNFCESLAIGEYKAQFLVLSIAFGSLLIMSLIYLQIFCEVQKVQARAHYIYPEGSLHSNKAVITTVLIMGTFYLCWLPYCIFQSILLAQVHFNSKIVTVDKTTTKYINGLLAILLLINCLLDPLIYAFRLRVVRNGYKNFIIKIKIWWQEKHRTKQQRKPGNSINYNTTFPMLNITRKDNAIQTCNSVTEDCNLV